MCVYDVVVVGLPEDGGSSGAEGERVAAEQKGSWTRRNAATSSGYIDSYADNV